MTTSPASLRTTIPSLFGIVLVLSGGCASVSPNSHRGDHRIEVTVAQRAQLESFDSLIPIALDSVIALYDRFPPEEFYSRYNPLVGFVSGLVDSFNSTVSPLYAIDTLCIDPDLEDFAEAGLSGHTLLISSSYFFLFNDVHILRSVLTHEFGHIHYRMLDSATLHLTDSLWNRLQEAALFYLFRDGEYSGNTRFGGHPEESSAELYASAYNLVRNRPDELHVRFCYVDSVHIPLLMQVERLVTRSP